MNFLTCVNLVSDVGTPRLMPLSMGTVRADNLTQLMDRANSELKRLTEWYNSNLLLLHPLKTKALIFSPPRYVLDLNKIDNRLFFPVFLNMNNENEFNISKIVSLQLVPNPEEESAKFLGLYLDEKLTLKCHFKQMHIKINRAIYTLRQMKNILDRRHLKLLYTSYIKSIIDYSCPVFSCANQATIQLIFLLQKKAIRLICGAGYRDPTGPLFKLERLLPIQLLIIYNSALFMYDYRHGLLPKIFKAMGPHGTWPLRSDIHQHGVRNADDFFITYVHSIYLKSHPLYALPRTWNALPQELKIINGRKEFKRKLFQHLLDLIVV
jgi:hypothetical protein